MLLLVSVLLTASASAQVRVMNWNVARLNGDPVAIEDVFAASAADDRSSAVEGIAHTSSHTIFLALAVSVSGASSGQSQRRGIARRLVKFH